MIDWSHLLNTQKYHPFELFLFGGGCYMWVFVYAIYIKKIVKLKYIEMPVFAACGNIGWEFVWSFLLKPDPDMGSLILWCYRIWFFFDLFIFYSVLRYGAEQVMTTPIRKHFRPLAVVTAVGWGSVFYAMKRSGLDTHIGANSAFVLNFVISLLYIFLFLQQLQRRQVHQMSYAVAWLKMIGTGMNTIFMNIHPEYSGDYFLRLFAIMTTVLDCSYIFLLWRYRRLEALSTERPDLTSRQGWRALPTALSLRAGHLFRSLL
jgi:hypothetical protein